MAEADDAPVMLHAQLEREAVTDWRDTMRCQNDVNDRFLGAIEIDHGPPA